MSARPFRVRTVARAPTSSTNTRAYVQVDITESVVRQVKQIEVR